MKSQALGRGLGALLGEIDEAYENEVPQKDSIIEISLKDIRPNPYQPRKTFDEETLIELGESIKKDGLIQPIIVKEDIDGYIIIAGERRFRASKLAKLRTIRAIVLNSDETKMRQFALIENIQRDELNSIELAFAYSELIKLHDITHDELSSKIHKSRVHITNTVRLLQLSPKTQRSLIEKKITTGHAKVLIGLDEKAQQLMVNSIIGQKLNVREVETMIKNMREDNPSPDFKTVSVTFDFSKIKNKFDFLGLKAKSSKNKLTIEFDDENQIEEFLNYLSK
ncbi:ParB/RepB/Spo0J family partition protein [bacterium]|nr:ParB/RepB/Spo0J family partition protein [bacterium]MBU1994656.1 ParB/RepB/Spo0J family partition protein [bacterium]